MSDGRWKDRAGFDLGLVGFKMPEEHLGGAAYKAVECLCLDVKRKLSIDKRFEDGLFGHSPHLIVLQMRQIEAERNRLFPHFKNKRAHIS